jgi:hypothetical protein
MERPSLKRLWADIEAGKIDVVVVYKVDRLTRSLADFAKIVDLFDRCGVSFVSVTQAFNTTSSMGRLTLNVLLSFAQFEREVTGERIRDKIAASKARGMWMGGRPPLGYDPPKDRTQRALVVNEAEATTVRRIFAKYLELRSVHDVKRWLEAEDIRSKAHVCSTGREIGGLSFNRGALFYLLQNRIYVGEIVHKDVAHPGLHPAIVDRSTFDAAQALLASNGRKHRSRVSRSSTAPLRGLVFDADGASMSPSFTYKGEQVHRYYVSASLQQGQATASDDLIRRVPAGAVEDLVLDRIQSVGRPGNVIDWSAAKGLLRRVEVHSQCVQIVTTPARSGDLEAEVARIQKRLGPGERASIDPAHTGCVRLVLPVRLKLRGGRSWLTTPSGAPAVAKPRVSPKLVNGLRSAHGIISDLGLKPSTKNEHLAEAKAPLSVYSRKLSRLAFLAPDIQLAILEGRQPVGLCVEQLIDDTLPMAWEDQRRILGFTSEPAESSRRRPSEHVSAAGDYIAAAAPAKRQRTASAFRPGLVDQRPSSIQMLP